ncbi:MAG: discoidin domain-containing protein [Prevotella sp.]|nr:discoidin domain-containing protein [Prevotella sp.]
MKNILLLACLLASATFESVAQTRGIGLYPGAPSEYYAPSVSWAQGDGSLTNVALHRVAYASSAIDYNHTAHLVTDGICNDEQPATLTVFTPQGQLPRREAEWAIDGGPYSRNILMGSNTWLQYHWNGAQPVVAAKMKLQGMVAYDDRAATKGYALRCQTSDDGKHWQTIGELRGDGLPGTPLHYKLHSDPNKQEAQDYLPARVLSEEVRFASPVALNHFRVQLEMEGAAHWDIRELQFSDADGREAEVLPSRQFSSLWMSNGGDEQWLYTDLGCNLPVEQVNLCWYAAPKKGCIQVSNDALTWTTVADLNPNDNDNVNDNLNPNVNGNHSQLSFISYHLAFSEASTARYVRVLMQQPGEAGCYGLREMQALSRKKLVYTPHAVAGGPSAGRRYELSGGNWRLQRASEVKATGEQIASAHFDDANWMAATVPGTVLASLMNIGAVPNPNYADEADEISESYFRSNFWYRDEFEADSLLGQGQQQWLCFDGINWKANVYLNGYRLGRIEGTFKRARFNVTGLLCKGTNYLAVEIVCNDHFAAIKEKDENTTQFNGGMLGADNPTFHATVGWDWITTVRGREAGIWNEVYLTATDMVTMSDPYVKTELSADGQTARVSPSVFVCNNASHSVAGVLSGWIGDVKFEKSVTLPANSEQEVTFTAEEFQQLASDKFRLWWPNGYGEPTLYDAGFSFGGGEPLTYKAGLREMKYVGAKDSLRIYINGRRFIPLGGNWGFDEHNLLYRSREYDIAVGYHRDMNFTMIRNWVGQVADESFYEACDRHGIMVWQDFWLANPADGPDPYDNRMFLENAEDYVRRIRSHACIGLYCGRNEGFPPEALDRKLREYVHTLSPGVEYISHSSGEGVSGGGPYRALPMKEYFSRQSGKIHSERGMPNVMNIESLRRTFSPDALWPQSKQWGQHDFTLQGAQRASEFNRMVSDGFGSASSAEEFARWAQLINYNGYRGMFESTSSSRAGLLLWMSHPCWPSMVWQTYDYYFEPTAAYFGAKKACEPLHIQYNALTDSIEVVNHSAGLRTALTATATVFDLNGKKVCQQKKTGLSSSEDTTKAWAKLSRMMAKAPSDVYFLRLTLNDKRGTLSENLYIMGREEGNFRALTSLPKAEVEQKVKKSGPCQLSVTLRNKSDVPAPWLRLNLKGNDGEQILPAVYSDNYITLMPGEEQTITIEWKAEDARGQQPVVEITSLR